MCSCDRLNGILCGFHQEEADRHREAWEAMTEGLRVHERQRRMELSVNQALGIAAVRLLRDAGEDVIAGRTAQLLVESDLFVDEPIVGSLRMMLDTGVSA